MEVERLPLHSNNVQTNRDKRCLCDQEKCDKYLCILTSIFVVILIILSLYQLSNNINKTNMNQNQTIHSNDNIVRKNCDNYYDLLHNEGLCDYLIDNNIHPCSEFYCHACRYRGYCDRSCGYCE